MRNSCSFLSLQIKERTLLINAVSVTKTETLLPLDPRLPGLIRVEASNTAGRVHPWREKRLEMALIQISVPARENYRVIKGF
jgi:hypothetical protein